MSIRLEKAHFDIGVGGMIFVSLFSVWSRCGRTVMDLSRLRAQWLPCLSVVDSTKVPPRRHGPIIDQANGGPLLARLFGVSVELASAKPAQKPYLQGPPASFAFGISFP